MKFKISIFLFFSIFTNLFAIDVLESSYSKTIECNKGDIYLLNEKEEEELKRINLLFHNVNEICSWNEMYGLNDSEKCDNFNQRLLSLNKTNRDLNSEFKKFKKLHNSWKPFFNCRSSLRFDATNFFHSSTLSINKVNKNIKSLNLCRKNIKSNLQIVCAPKFKEPVSPRHKYINVKSFNNSHIFPKYIPHNNSEHKKKVIVIKPI